MNTRQPKPQGSPCHNQLFLEHHLTTQKGEAPMPAKLANKKSNSINRIRRVKLIPVEKLDRTIDVAKEAQGLDEDLNEKICVYAVDLQTSPRMQVDIRHIIEEIQDNQRRQIPTDRQYELAETKLSLLIANVCLAERMLASR
jgi:hypothetical protein